MEYIDVACNLCGDNNYTPYTSGPDFEYHCSDDEFFVVKCNNCGLVYLNPRPAPSEISTIYPDCYIPYKFDEHLPALVNKMRMSVQASKIISIKKIAGPGSVIWDVGCAGGFFLECLRKYGRKGWQLSGVDVSPEAIGRVEVKGFNTILGRFETLDVKEETVDVIILNQVIEHLDDPAAVIRKSYSVLKKGGGFEKPVNLKEVNTNENDITPFSFFFCF